MSAHTQLISAIFLFPIRKEVNTMYIKAQIVTCAGREIETTRGKKFLTDLYLIDADTNKNFYVAQILSDRAYSYKESEIVTFPITGIVTKKKKIYLYLTPEEAVGVS